MLEKTLFPRDYNGDFFLVTRSSKSGSSAGDACLFLFCIFLVMCQQFDTENAICLTAAVPKVQVK